MLCDPHWPISGYFTICVHSRLRVCVWLCVCLCLADPSRGHASHRQVTVPWESWTTGPCCSLQQLFPDNGELWGIGNRGFAIVIPPSLRSYPSSLCSSPKTWAAKSHSSPQPCWRPALLQSCSAPLWVWVLRVFVYYIAVQFERFDRSFSKKPLAAHKRALFPLRCFSCLLGFYNCFCLTDCPFLCDPFFCPYLFVYLCM